MQIRIYTDSDSFDKDKVIMDNDTFFDEYITAEQFDKVERDALMQIDRAKVIDKNIGTIRTPRGVTSLENLSTGCKTVINYLFIESDKIEGINRNVIDISHCGANALKFLFEHIKKSDKAIPLILMHKDNVFECGDAEYIINDKKKVDNLIFM